MRSSCVLLQLLLDCELGDTTAIELLQSIDSKATHLMESGLRIFLMSGNDRPDSLDAELASLKTIKVEGYWTKPIDSQTLETLAAAS